VVQRVLDAALGELAASGVLGFRMAEVAARAGVNKTTLYRRWPDREALVRAVVERLREPLRARPLPDTGELEADLVEAFARRFAVSRQLEGRAWARLREEQHRPEVRALIGDAVSERRAEWHAMLKRGIARGELPAGTDLQLVFEVVRAIVDSRRARVDRGWVTLAVRTAIAAARAGTLKPIKSPSPSPQRGRGSGRGVTVKR
jgi:AcrR family transcriptional regulator